MGGILKTPQVEQDLIEIWLYTAERWGEAQADAYLRKIEKGFASIKAGRALLRKLADPVHFVRCEHHIIFVLTEGDPMVIAVLHEKMDLVARLRERLG